MINILLIEDDEGDIFLIKKAIKKAHMKSNIIVVTAGDEALHILNKENRPEIDFIITDLNMPRMNGHEFLEQVQKDKDLRKIPIAVLTNSWESEDYVKSMSLDAVICLPKPLDQKKLKKILNSMVDFWKNADDNE